MIGNMKPSEVCAVVGTIDPDAYTAATTVSDYVDMGKFESVLFVIAVGTMASTATLDAVVKQATDSSGTGAKNLDTSKAITQLTEAGTDSDKQVLVEVRAEDLDLANDFDHVALSVTGATAASDYGVIALGFNPRVMPASDGDLASVDEIV
ncbi:MAG: hypothetical protein KJN67_04490 [Pontiella sp.]|nr:hypothetical protein [Pontiella sp.]